MHRLQQNNIDITMCRGQSLGILKTGIGIFHMCTVAKGNVSILTISEVSLQTSI